MSKRGSYLGGHTQGFIRDFTGIGKSKRGKFSQGLVGGMTDQGVGKITLIKAKAAKPSPPAPPTDPKPRKKKKSAPSGKWLPYRT
ncbi:hypothetical protein [Aureimonas altamirensis]|uniref:hypothetical protein n=1 Tax=Aureimonas altamirensis TaxID=370622 RepID=UPI00255623C5|nr:hypothetical protein [Aureimonas altamirensis]